MHGHLSRRVEMHLKSHAFSASIIRQFKSDKNLPKSGLNSRQGPDRERLKRLTSQALGFDPRGADAPGVEAERAP